MPTSDCSTSFFFFLSLFSLSFLKLCQHRHCTVTKSTRARLTLNSQKVNQTPTQSGRGVQRMTNTRYFSLPPRALYIKTIENNINTHRWHSWSGLELDRYRTIQALEFGQSKVRLCEWLCPLGLRSRDMHNACSSTERPVTRISREWIQFTWGQPRAVADDSEDLSMST